MLQMSWNLLPQGIVLNYGTQLKNHQIDPEVTKHRSVRKALIIVELPSDQF